MHTISTLTLNLFLRTAHCYKRSRGSQRQHRKRRKRDRYKSSVKSAGQEACHISIGAIGQRVQLVA